MFAHPAKKGDGVLGLKLDHFRNLLRFAQSFYASTVHTKKNIDDYLNDLDTVFYSLKDLDFDDDNTRKKIGNLCHSGFKRLN